MKKKPALLFATLVLIAGLGVPWGRHAIAATLINLTNQVTGVLPVANGGSGAGSIAGADYVLTSTAANALAFEQINGGSSCGDSSHALNYSTSTHLLGCQAISGSGFTSTICNGTVALATSAISSGAKSSAITATCTGLASTDNIMLDFNADPSGVTGYAPSASGTLTLVKFPTTNTINIWQYNDTANSVTPGSMTLNYRVVR